MRGALRRTCERPRRSPPVWLDTKMLSPKVRRPPTDLHLQHSRIRLMSSGSADWQRHSHRTRMIDKGAFALPRGTRACCFQARAGLRLWPPQLARRHAQWRRVRRGTGRAARGTAILVGSVAAPGSSGESAAGAGLPERRCSGYCSSAAWYCSSVTGSSHVVPSPPGDALEHCEVAHEVSGGSAVPVFLAWRGVDGVAGTHADDCAVAGLHEPDAVGNVQGLADGVGVPVGPGAGGEPDE